MDKVESHLPSDWPRITVVTPSLNQGAFLEATLCSVLEQNYPNLEYIVVDGGSQDGSVEILRRYSDRLNYWVSEPDAGQTDAILKGFAKASGEIINWLNSDDLLLPDALFAVALAYRERNAQIIVGEDLHFTDDLARPAAHFRPAGYNYPGCLRFWEADFRYHQPCTFFTRKLYEHCEGLDLSLHYLMDYDLYCQMLAQPGATVAYLNQPISAFRLHPHAKTSRHKTKFLAEQRAVSQRYWEQAGFDQDSTQQAMDKYCAACGVFHAAELIRKYRVFSGLYCLYQSLLLDFRVTGKICLHRGFSRLLDNK